MYYKTKTLKESNSCTAETYGERNVSTILSVMSPCIRCSGTLYHLQERGAALDCAAAAAVAAADALAMPPLPPSVPSSPRASAPLLLLPPPSETEAVRITTSCSFVMRATCVLGCDE